jgi:hypothetical protein
MADIGMQDGDVAINTGTHPAITLLCLTFRKVLANCAVQSHHDLCQLSKELMPFTRGEQWAEARFLHNDVTGRLERESNPRQLN